MLERMSALAGYAGPLSKDGPAPVIFAPVAPAVIAMVTAFPASDQSVRSALHSATGLAAPEPGRFAIGAGKNGEATLATLSPGRYLLLSDFPDLVAVLEPAIGAEMGAVTDLRHARTLLGVSGARAEALLMSGIMLDLSSVAFPVGSVAQTLLHHMDVTILRRDETSFELAVFRGFAVSLVEWLTDAASETGFELRPADRSTAGPSAL